MIKILLLITIACCLTSFSTADVYICNSKSAKRYHFNKDYQGLSNCKAEIVKESLETAKADGKTLCGFED